MGDAGKWNQHKRYSPPQDGADDETTGRDIEGDGEKISWIDAAEMTGTSVRNMQRKRHVYQEYGYTGLFDTTGRAC